jgi:hypothetical protein
MGHWHQRNPAIFQTKTALSSIWRDTMSHTREVKGRQAGGRHDPHWIPIVFQFLAPIRGGGGGVVIEWFDWVEPKGKAENVSSASSSLVTLIQQKTPILTQNHQINHRISSLSTTTSMENYQVIPPQWHLYQPEEKGKLKRGPYITKAQSQNLSVSWNEYGWQMKYTA